MWKESFSPSAKADPEEDFHPLSDEARRFADLMAQSNDILVESRNYAIVYISPNCARILGWPPEGFLGKRTTDFVHPDDMQPLQKQFEQGWTGDDEPLVRIRHASGDWRWFQIGYRRTHFEGGFRSIIMLRDVHSKVEDHQTLLQLQGRLEAVLSASPDVLIELRNQHITYISANAALAYGPAAPNLLGQHFASIVHPDDLPALMPYAAQGWEGTISAEFRMRDGSGAWAWREARGVRRHAADGTPYAILILRDTSQRKELEQALAERAIRDPLTGLINHGAVLEELERLCQERAICTILMVDADRLKLINDTLGHAAGDEALRLLARALTHRSSAIVGRYGGDEFLVLLPGAGASEAHAYQNAVARRFRRNLRHAQLGVAATPLSASFGAAAFPADGLEPRILIERADRAMYEMKRRTRSRRSTDRPARRLKDDAA